MSDYKWKVWLGHQAHIWSHRGYKVRGETVYTVSRADAEWVARSSLPDTAVCVRADDGQYWYADKNEAARDDTGALARAVVSRNDDD